MFFSPKIYFRDRWITPSFIVAIASQLIMWWYSVSQLRPLTEQIFLHYNSIFGVDLVGSWLRVLYIPLLGLVILIVNGVGSFMFYASERFLSRLIIIAAGIFNVLLLVGLWFLVGINI